ncbi:MAG: GntR family transcriptional regulator [Victivallaceae bacterium]
MIKHSRPGYLKMTERLETLIASGSYRAGDKLPGLRALSEEFDLTTYAVHEGLKSLHRKGVLILRHGSGAYVAGQRDGRSGIDTWQVTVFVSTERHGAGYLSYSLLGFQEEAMRNNCSVTFRKRDYYEFYAPEPPLYLDTGSNDGVAFLGEYDYRLRELPLTTPAVGIEMDHTFGGIVSPISLDPMSTALLAAEYFRRHGKKKVEVHYFAGAPVFRRRAECFRMVWSEYGEVGMKQYPLAPDPYMPVDPEVGLLFCGGSYCETCAEHYRRVTDRMMPKDFTVLSIDGKSLLMPGYTQVSTISIDWRAAGETAFLELLRRMQNPSAEPRRIYIVPKLNEI